MKFIADAMLGKLAKWLRILGFDVLYDSSMEDRQIIRTARDQERTILTRDTRMLQLRSIGDAVFIKSDDVFQQLLEMKKNLHLNDRGPAARCIVCNGSLNSVAEKDELKGLVPEYVYHNFKHFFRCSSCGKVYWDGSHYEKIREKLREVLKEECEN
jgi:uncharacterized protein